MHNYLLNIKIININYVIHYFDPLSYSGEGSNTYLPLIEMMETKCMGVLKMV